MTLPLDRAAVARMFLAACHAELAALKPGNVHVHAAGHGMDIHHFERAAAAAAPFIADPDLGVGARIHGAVAASFTATGLNTNLGIVLLCAPLAAAAEARDGPPGLRERLIRILDGLTLEDATGTFEAILLANPAGLGRAGSGDVHEVPAMTLREAMALAADRDRIARAYVTAYADIFDLGLPELYATREAAENESTAITALHMRYLAAFPDSHIARKHGLAAAEGVQEEARQASRLLGTASQDMIWSELLAFDRSLKARGLNPGTTADLVVATVFTDMLIRACATNKLV